MGFPQALLFQQHSIDSTSISLHNSLTYSDIIVYNEAVPSKKKSYVSNMSEIMSGSLKKKTSNLTYSVWSICEHLTYNWVNHSASDAQLRTPEDVVMI